MDKDVSEIQDSSDTLAARYDQAYWQAYFSNMQTHQQIRDRAAVQNQQYLQGSIDYGKLTIQSVLFVNAGGLVAIPAYLLSNPQQFEEFVKIAGIVAIIFGFGVVFIIISCFFAYLNYNLWIRHSGIEWEISETFERMRYRDISRHIESRYLGRLITGDNASDEKLIEEKKKEKRPLSCKITLTQCFSILFGWLSGILFIVGTFLSVDSVALEFGFI